MPRPAALRISSNMDRSSVINRQSHMMNKDRRTSPKPTFPSPVTRPRPQADAVRPPCLWPNLTGRAIEPGRFSAPLPTGDHVDVRPVRSVDFQVTLVEDGTGPVARSTWLCGFGVTKIRRAG